MKSRKVDIDSSVGHAHASTRMHTLADTCGGVEKNHVQICIHFAHGPLCVPIVFIATEWAAIRVSEHICVRRQSVSMLLLH